MILDILKELSVKSNIPNEEFIIESLIKGIASIYETPENIRPRDLNDNPGGVFNLKGRKVIIIPDLHARREYLYKIIKHFYNELNNSSCTILFLGDYLHTEVTTRDRWLMAFNEYQDNYKVTTNIDKEICDNLYTLIMLGQIKSAFKDRVLFIKGNHDNIYNSCENGNRAFRKYAMEGDMVIAYLIKFYSKELVDVIDKWEGLYGIFAYGDNFVASHAEPKEFYGLTELINYKYDEDLVYNLTWTRNDIASPEVTEYFVKTLLRDEGYYVAGHRHIPGKYKLRSKYFIQIHNPRIYPYMVVEPSKKIEPQSDIYTLDEIIGKENN